MKLENKRSLIARTLCVGKDRVGFNRERLGEVKEAITKQDIRDLAASGAIFVREIKGRKTKIRGGVRRRAGRVRQPSVDRKREYVIITRKLRAYLGELRKQGSINKDQFDLLRRELRAKKFRSKAHLKERITLLRKT